MKTPLTPLISLGVCIALFMTPHAYGSVSAMGYFDIGAKAYYVDDLEAAKEAVNIGLERYPQNEELSSLRDLIEREQQRQEQQQQNSDEQEEGDEGEEGEQGEQGEQGQEGQQGQEGEQGQEGDQGQESADNSNQQQPGDQEGQEGEQGENGGEQQNERTAEEYADQTLEDGDSGQIGEPEENSEGDPSQAMDSAQEGRPVYMTEEEAMRLLETLSGQERQLPFYNIDRNRDADKFSREKRNY